MSNPTTQQAAEQLTELLRPALTPRAPLFFGSGGRNGKGTLLELMRSLGVTP